MGNSGSQYPAVTEVQPNEQWVHSFPRTQHPQPKHNFQHKVLPERNAHLKLRSTNNGEILHSGGTISGRHAKFTDEIKEKCVRERSAPFDDSSSNDGRELMREKDSSRKIAHQGVKHKLNNNVSSQQIKSFASEPDLRYTPMHGNHDYRDKKSKKKYKAPSPPRKYMVGSDKQSSGKEDFNPGLPIRKARLFKTRAETKKKSSHLNETSDEYASPNNTTKANEKSKRLSLPEVKLIDSNDFYKELKDATNRLRHVEVDECKPEPSSSNRTKLQTLDPNISSSKDLKERLMEKIENRQCKNPMINCTRDEASGKESTTPDMSPSPTSKDLLSKDKRPKQLFYFGMDENIEENQPRNGVFENFNTNIRVQHSSESDISSDIESDEHDICRSGIDLQLRPILPKKQLEIPRFSPAAAWRLLSLDANDNTTGTMISDDTPLLMEDHIEKYSRPPPPLVNVGQRFSNDKSGDSGISGDDGDAVIPIAYCYDDVTSANDTNTAMQKNKIPIKYLNKPERISWTPQQDLGDDSSIDEDLQNEKLLQTIRPRDGPHTFSLSLPRDNRLASYMVEKNNIPHYSGLQKFKKSLTGVLGNLSNKKEFLESNVLDEKSANWFLSKSAPNSLTHTFHSLERHRMQDTEDQPYPSHANASARIIYLPEIDLDFNNDRYQRPMKNYKYSQYSKSCEDIGLELEKHHPQELQDPPISHDDSSWKIKRKPKKYTFQSTIRQIEKKRLSDKLSREAEKRERKRIRELEAMQKVEEEFQKKRAREKANIRQQLRLFSMDDNSGWHSLPPNFELDHKERRSEPDGAFSSVCTSSCSTNNTYNQGCQDMSYHKSSNTETKQTSYTRELSEYRQTQRDYRDYNSNLKYTHDKGHSRQTTIHPQVSCNMPKVKGLKVKDDHNYRKEFVAGVRSLLSNGSTHSEDSQNYSNKNPHRNKSVAPGYNSYLPS
ncbi:unnamed protein product [Diabrotica balteata]|uniref:Uncharacterized protein n=1 Tax=Diabrotica balteata TaxID=107213 RepID=A0A9N9SSD6_DIABA|nr:unnamed protein product [Diabrotica balteata]